MAIKFLCIAVSVMIIFTVTINADDDSLMNKCAEVLPKVMNCVAFATARAPTPSADCCGAVGDVRATDPACLCYIIQQVHNGSNAAVRSMGLQEARLLQLPSACRVANASVADCPRLLHLAPGSPDAVIFTNTSATTAPVSAGSSSSSTSGLRHKPRIGGSVISAVIVFLAFTSIFMS